MPKTQGIAASVIIPAYNSAAAVFECLKALKAQDFGTDNFEVIVVDDGSLDNTAEVAQRAGAKVLRQRNAGPAKARNLGAKGAGGEILVLTDADCVPEKGWLSEMLRPFGEKGVIGVQGAYKTRQKSLTARFAQIEIEERYERMKRHEGKLDWVGSYSAAYRRGDFFAAGGFDESFPKASGEDPELSYKMHKMGKRLVFNPDAIVYHTHPDTLWKYLRTKFYRAYYRVNLYSKHPDKIARDSYTPPDVKLQLFSAFAGMAFLAISIAHFYWGNNSLGSLFGMISLGIGAIGVLASLRLTFLAARTDLAAALFSVAAIQLRNFVFLLGLAMGFAAEKVLR